MILEIILIALGVVILFSLISIGWFIGVFNTFRVGQQDIKTQWSNIKTEYQRRSDMLYNLVQAVKSHKNFEKETLVQTIAARGGKIDFGQSKASQMKTMKGLDGMLSRLMVVFERYPKLQSNEQHNKLMDEIRITEDRINVARTDYNEIVGDYNKLVKMFPSTIVASMFRFGEEMFFENEESTNKAPRIEL